MGLQHLTRETSMAAPYLIDWSSTENVCLLNPRMPPADHKRLLKAVGSANDLENHLWLATSGSSGRLKLVGLSKQAILLSAQAVNNHLQSTSTDIWLNSLPVFHVGGLGIWARAYLSGATVVADENARWNPQNFVSQLKKSATTLTSLVPAQVYDLVLLEMQAPQSLRAVIVGGGAINETLYEKAVRLGWKLLPSYGMTECASQIATAPLGSWETGHYPPLQPLSHVTLGQSEEGLLKIKSQALLTAYIFLENDTFRKVDPKINDWFTTEDKALIENGYITKISRETHFVKIGGESVDLLRLEMILNELMLFHKFDFDAALVARQDTRLGHTIHLVVDTSNHIDTQILVENFSKKVLPFERIRHIHHLNKIPRSPLKKLLTADLEVAIQKHGSVQKN